MPFEHLGLTSRAACMDAAPFSVPLKEEQRAALFCDRDIAIRKPLACFHFSLAEEPSPGLSPSRSRLNSRAACMAAASLLAL